MKITIEIHNPYINTLAAWASVSRTLNSAKYACEAALDAGIDDERIRICLDELNKIEPALNHLHVTARQEIWNVTHT